MKILPLCPKNATPINVLLTLDINGLPESPLHIEVDLTTSWAQIIPLLKKIEDKPVGSSRHLRNEMVFIIAKCNWLDTNPRLSMAPFPIEITSISRGDAHSVGKCTGCIFCENRTFCGKWIKAVTEANYHPNDWTQFKRFAKYKPISFQPWVRE